MLKRTAFCIQQEIFTKSPPRYVASVPTSNFKFTKYLQKQQKRFQTCSCPSRRYRSIENTKEGTKSKSQTDSNKTDKTINREVPFSHPTTFNQSKSSL